MAVKLDPNAARKFDEFKNRAQEDPCKTATEFTRFLSSMSPEGKNPKFYQEASKLEVKLNNRCRSQIPEIVKAQADRIQGQANRIGDQAMEIRRLQEDVIDINAKLNIIAERLRIIWY